MIKFDKAFKINEVDEIFNYFEKIDSISTYEEFAFIDGCSKDGKEVKTKWQWFNEDVLLKLAKINGFKYSYTTDENGIAGSCFCKEKPNFEEKGFKLKNNDLSNPCYILEDDEDLHIVCWNVTEI